MRYRRRRSEPRDVARAAGVALGVGLGVAASVFYLAWNWLRREPLGPGPSRRSSRETPEEAPDGA